MKIRDWTLVGSVGRVLALLPIPLWMAGILPHPTAQGAPAPCPRPIAALLDIEGSWKITWGTIVYNMSLDCGKTPGAQGGLYWSIEAPNPSEEPPHIRWTGSWTYDPSRGTLRIHETTDDGEHWSYWEVDLDGRGRGEAVYGPRGKNHSPPTPMHMERCRKIPTPQ